MAFAFSYPEAFAFLCRMYGIAPARSVAFRGRLQHLQRLGFPAGVNTGRGRPARYEAEQMIMLALALQFIELGLTPERAVSVLQTRAGNIADAVAAALRGRGEIYLLIDPDGLGTFRESPPPSPGLESEFASATEAEKDIAVRSLSWWNTQDMMGEVMDVLHFCHHVAVIGLSTILSYMESWLEADRPGYGEAFKEAAIAWASQNGSGEGAGYGKRS